MAKTDPHKAAVKGVDEREAVKQSAVDDYYARADAAQPTPTQRENDLAKVNALDIDDKEDDGSGPQMVQHRVMAPADAKLTYDTKDAGKK